MKNYELGMQIWGEMATRGTRSTSRRQGYGRQARKSLTGRSGRTGRKGKNLELRDSGNKELLTADNTTESRGSGTTSSNIRG